MVADKRTKRSFEPKRGVGARCVAFAQAEGLIVRSVAGDTLSLVRRWSYRRLKSTNCSIG